MANKDMIQIYKQRLVHSIELQTMLQSIDLISVEEIAKSISGNDYFCTKEGKNRLLKILFASIKSFPKFMKRYSQLIKVMDNYFCNIDSIKILEIFGDYYPILSSFYDIGIFSLKDVIHFSVLNIKPFIYFFNEITRIRNKTEDRHDSEQLSKYEKKLYNARVEMISPDDLNFMEKISKEKYFELINDCQNMSKLAQIIRSDRLLKFVKYISMKNINYNAKLNYSILEANSLTNNKEKMPELVEYAAYCGSHKIFTYLLEKLIKKGSVPNTLSDYACAGGHLKIVKLLNYYRFDFGESCIHNAIEYQQNEVLDYLIKEKHMEITLFSKMFCIQSMNLLEFLNLVKQNDINDDLKRRCIRKTATLYGISEIR